MAPLRLDGTWGMSVKVSQHLLKTGAQNVIFSGIRDRPKADKIIDKASNMLLHKEKEAEGSWDIDQNYF